MSPAAQRYEVSQIFAECEERGFSRKSACVAAVLWFEKHGIELPASILDWLAEVPAAEWRPDRLH